MSQRIFESACYWLGYAFLWLALLVLAVVVFGRLCNHAYRKMDESIAFMEFLHYRRQVRLGKRKPHGIDLAKAAGIDREEHERRRRVKIDGGLL